MCPSSYGSSPQEGFTVKRSHEALPCGSPFDRFPKKMRCRYKVLFAGSSTRELVFSWFLLSLCQRRRLVDLGTRVLGQSWICLSPGKPLSKVLLSSVKQSAFAHFCGGESLEDCVATGKQLEAHAGVKCIVDWGVEESSDAKFWDSNTERKVKTLHRAKEVLGSNAAFMPIKLTSLLSPCVTRAHHTGGESGPKRRAWHGMAGLAG